MDKVTLTPEIMALLSAAGVDVAALPTTPARAPRGADQAAKRAARVARLRERVEGQVASVATTLETLAGSVGGDLAPAMREAVAAIRDCLPLVGSWEPAADTALPTTGAGAGARKLQPGDTVSVRAASLPSVTSRYPSLDTDTLVVVDREGERSYRVRDAGGATAVLGSRTLLAAGAASDDDDSDDTDD